MYCPECGKKIEDNAAYCPYCGKAVATNNQEKTTTNSSEGYHHTDTSQKKPAAKKSRPVLRTVGIICASLCIFFAVLFGVSLVYQGVQEQENAKLSDINVIAAQRAVNTADKYLNGETRFATEAVKELEDALNLMEPADTEESEEITRNVKNSITIILNEIQNEQILNGGKKGDGDMKKVKENRDLLAQYANLE